MVSHVVRLRWLWPRLSEETLSQRDKAVTKAENDMAAISISLLISQVLRFAIHGNLPPIDPVPVYHEQEEASILLACGVASIVSTIVLSRLRILAERNRSPWQRLAEAFQLLSVMTMAWIILFWGHWEVYDVQFRDEPLLGRIVLAVCLSGLAVLVIFALKGLMDVGKETVTQTVLTILEGVALMIAFSWELAFDRAADGLADGAHLLDRHSFKFIMCVLIVLLCFPGYVFFFLPMSLDLPDEQQTSIWRDSSRSSFGSSFGSSHGQNDECSEPMARSADSEINVQKKVSASDIQSSAPPSLQENVKTANLANRASMPPATLAQARGEHCQFQCFVFSCLCQLLRASRTQAIANSPICPPLKQTGIGKHEADPDDVHVMLGA